MRRYNVTDSSGNAAVEVTRIINVTDNQWPDYHSYWSF